MYRFKLTENLAFYLLSTFIATFLISCSDRGDKKFSAEEKKAREQSENSEDSLEDNRVDKNPSKDESPKNQLPDNAQTIGSFTVYTLPEDPKPLQDYSIIVQMELPSNLDNYDPRDMFIYVQGTDS